MAERDAKERENLHETTRGKREERIRDGGIEKLKSMRERKRR